MKFRQYINKISTLKIKFKSLEVYTINNIEVIIVNLYHPIKVTGSIDFSGFPLICQSDKIYFASDAFPEVKIKCKNTCGTLFLNGKFDVSRPRMTVIDGKPVLTKPSKIWIVKELFVKIFWDNKNK